MWTSACRVTEVQMRIKVAAQAGLVIADVRELALDLGSLVELQDRAARRMQSGVAKTTPSTTLI